MGDKEDNPPHDLENSEYSSFIDKYKVVISFFLLGLIFVGCGVFLYKNDLIGSSDKIEIIQAENTDSKLGNDVQIIVEISGSVEKPGVYKLPEAGRVEDLLIASGGLSVDADRVWVDKYVNRAAKLTDGQKLYIPKLGEQSATPSANNSGVIKLDQGVLGVGSSTYVNINNASLAELDKLPGIGQVYGQSIIDHRPYSDTTELVSKGALKNATYEKIKDLISVY